MHKSVMVVTAIRSVVSFLVGGVRDRHLRRPRWSPGLLWPTAPGTTAPPQNPSAQSPKSLPTQRRLWRKLMMPADLKRLHTVFNGVRDALRCIRDTRVGAIVT